MQMYAVRMGNHVDLQLQHEIIFKPIIFYIDHLKRDFLLLYYFYLKLFFKFISPNSAIITHNSKFISCSSDYSSRNSDK